MVLKRKNKATARHRRVVSRALRGLDSHGPESRNVKNKPIRRSGEWTEPIQKGGGIRTLTKAPIQVALVPDHHRFVMSARALPQHVSAIIERVETHDGAVRALRARPMGAERTRAAALAAVPREAKTLTLVTCEARGPASKMRSGLTGSLRYLTLPETRGGSRDHPICTGARSVERPSTCFQRLRPRYSGCTIEVPRPSPAHSIPPIHIGMEKLATRLTSLGPIRMRSMTDPAGGVNGLASYLHTHCVIARMHTAGGNTSRKKSKISARSLAL